METNKEINFGYRKQKIKLLEWEVKFSFDQNSSMFWEPEFEIFMGDIDANGHHELTIDAILYYRPDKDNYAFMIKTRNVFRVGFYNDYSNKNFIISILMDVALAHTRAICLDKNMEEKLPLPLIPNFKPSMLHRYANIRLFTPSLIECSYERRHQSGKLNAIVGNMNIGIEEFRNYVIKFEPKPITHPDSIIAGLTHKEGEMQGYANFNYDYEHHEGDEWKMHIDYGMGILPIAEIKVRSSFLLHCKEEELFSIPVLSVIIEEAIINCNERFTEQCKVHNIEFDGSIPANDEQLKMHSQHVINQYFGSRKKDDINNNKMKNDPQPMTFGENTILITKGTFMILDEILFHNNAFDHKHNWEAVSECPIIEPFYLTLKANYMEIEKGEIQLTFFQTVLFYLCLDVALQMMISEHSDKLQAALIKNNFVPERQKEYIKFGNEFYKRLNKNLKDCGATITNLEARRDWASIIR
jgi:hypothetical protein